MAAGHAFPHVWQLFGSLVVSTHLPLQSVSPEAHCATHEGPLHPTEPPVGAAGQVGQVVPLPQMRVPPEHCVMTQLAPEQENVAPDTKGQPAQAPLQSK
jgi:hypothetical protein